MCRIYITRQFCGFSDHSANAKIVGILDDDKALKNLNVYGFDVLGGTDDLENIYAGKPFDAIILTFNNISMEKLQCLQEFCRKNNVKLKRFICDETEMV